MYFFHYNFNWILNNLFNGFSSLNKFDLIILVTFIFIFISLLIANYYDLRYNIIPNNIIRILFLYGLILNITLSILFENMFFLLFSIIFASFVFLISYILWKLGFWGGGDLKIFTALSFLLAFLSRDFMINLLPDNFVLIEYYFSSVILNNLRIFGQFNIYPSVFSIILNGILISMPVLILVMFTRIIKDKRLNFKSYFIQNFNQSDYFYHVKYLNFLLKILLFNGPSIIRISNTKELDINDLEEGMILDNYYFNDRETFDRLNELIKINDRLNLSVFPSNDSNEGFYFKSSTAGGLSREDIVLIKYFYSESLLRSSEFNIKLAIPFLPSLTMGFLATLIFGDLIYIISHQFMVFL